MLFGQGPLPQGSGNHPEPPTKSRRTAPLPKYDQPLSEAKATKNCAKEIVDLAKLRAGTSRRCTSGPCVRRVHRGKARTRNDAKSARSEPLVAYSWALSNSLIPKAPRITAADRSMRVLNPR